MLLSQVMISLFGSVIPIIPQIAIQHRAWAKSKVHSRHQQCFFCSLGGLLVPVLVRLKLREPCSRVCGKTWGSLEARHSCSLMLSDSL